MSHNYSDPIACSKLRENDDILHRNTPQKLAKGCPFNNLRKKISCITAHKLFEAEAAI
jgi:hypothetical protein